MPACARSGAIVEADADPFLLGHIGHDFMAQPAFPQEDAARRGFGIDEGFQILGRVVVRSEEHTSELQSLMRISYAVFCLKKKKIPPDITTKSTKTTSYTT